MDFYEKVRVKVIQKQFEFMEVEVLSGV